MMNNGEHSKYSGGRGFSLRTLLLSVTGFSLVCGLFAGGAGSPVAAHTILVLAFAIPGGSLGYDRGHTSRSAVAGACIFSIAGTLILSAAVLVRDWWAVLS